MYRYAPAKKSLKTPMVISYALVNRPYMVDLQDDRSLVRNLLGHGVEIYLIDWGYPGPTERWVTLDDYLDLYFDACIEAVCGLSRQEAVNVLGICQGGTLALCYAALQPTKIKNLITMVAPVDFSVQAEAHTGLLNGWARHLDVDVMVDAVGNIPGDLMNLGYLMLRPFALNVGKYLKLPEILEDKEKLMNFLRMEKWIFDSPDQPGEFFRKFVRDFYQANRLFEGTLDINGRTIGLNDVRQPVLNIYAEQDHLVPPASSKALAGAIGSTDYTEQGFNTGHIGMYVSGKVQRELPDLVASWLAARDSPP